MNDVQVLFAMVVGGFLLGFVVCLIGKTLLLAPWLMANLSGGKVSAMTILTMRLRGNPVRMLIEAHLALIHSGQQVSIREVESTYIANRWKVQATQDLVELMRANADQNR